MHGRPFVGQTLIISKKACKPSILLPQDVSTESYFPKVFESSGGNIWTIAHCISHAAIHICNLQRYDEMDTTCDRMEEN